MSDETDEALEAIQAGYSYFVENGFVVVENPDYRPDDGSDPHLVIALSEREQALRDALENCSSDLKTMLRSPTLSVVEGIEYRLLHEYNALLTDTGDSCND